MVTDIKINKNGWLIGWLVVRRRRRKTGALRIRIL